MKERVDIGQELQAAREKMELVPADVQHRQRIPVRVVEALEKSDYSVFSSPAYARSYLKQYSEFVGVDATDWLDSFDVSGTLANLDAYDYLNVDPEDQPMPTSTRRVKKKKVSSEAASAGAMVPVLITLITAALLGAGFWGYSRLAGDQEERDEQAGKLAKGEISAAPAPPDPGRAPEKTETSSTEDPVENEGPVPIRIDPPQPIPRAVIVNEESE